LTTVSETLAEVDVDIALAAVALEFNFTRPQMVNEPVVMVKDGRHPLQELSVECFVPNDVYLNGTSDRFMAIVTGPNFSGKSVYLKMVGILVFLAHIGSFIPCTKAIIGLTDRLVYKKGTLGGGDR